MIGLNNKLTFLRILLTPLMLFLLYQQYYIASLIVLITAALSDIFDGHFARKHNKALIKFGIVFDPLADKIFIMTITIFFIHKQMITNFNLIAIYILFVREFFVTNMRILAKDDIKSNIFGKLKTFFLNLAIAFFIIYLISNNEYCNQIALTANYIACLFSLISAWPYVVLFRKLIIQ